MHYTTTPNNSSPRCPSGTLHVVPPLSSALIATDHMIAWSSMGILAIQFGIMPTLQKKFVPKQLCRSSVVLAQEVSKFALSTVCLLTLLSPVQRHQILQGWTVHTWWRLAGIPAALYAVQNYAKLMAYQHLPAVSYSVLNQTNTLMAAFFCYTLLGIPQSTLQMIALVLLIVAALVIEDVVQIRHLSRGMWRWSNRLSLLNWKQQALRLRPSKRRRRTSSLFSATLANPVLYLPDDCSGEDCSIQKDPYHFTRGVLPLLLANLTSGLAAALGQRVLRHDHRNLFLYGMELSSASSILVLLSLLVTKDGHQLQREGWKLHWTKQTWIPIAAHAVGGLLVGIVTKYAGSVQKGFALIFGVLLSGLFQKWLSHEPVTRQQIVGGCLACISLWMHSSFPPLP